MDPVCVLNERDSSAISWKMPLGEGLTVFGSHMPRGLPFWAWFGTQKVQKECRHIA
jgi:hypothetical protein